MIIYRFLGAGGILFSGLWLYFVREGFYKQRGAQLDAYIKLFTYIKNQIECYMLPIDRILYDCDPKILKECGLTSNKNISNIKDLLNHSTFYVGDDIISSLYSFTDEFGVSYLPEQIKLCDKFLIELKEIRENNKNQRIKDKKLSFAICMSLSLSLILILI